MATLKTADPKKSLLNFASIPITAYAKGTFITFEFEEDAFKDDIGAGGEAVRIMSNNFKVKCTVVLMAHSQDNDALSAIHVSDRINGDGVAVLDYKELNGTSRVHGEAYVSKTPNLERSDDAATVTWVFTMPVVDQFFLGGLTS